MAPRGSSAAWDHFVDTGNSIAQCKICKAKLSFKSTVSNLNKHLKRIHPLVLISEPRGEVITDEIASTNTTTTTSIATTASTATMASTASTSGFAGIRTTSTTCTSMSAYIIKKNASKCKSDIDDHIMNLFTMDFQPFRIVEDRGFKQLISFAFPFYKMPSRKYFSNNLLPSKYEGLRNEKLLQVAEKAHSICLTCDIWTSRANDAYLAITGHYIDNLDFGMKSILLECVSLEGSHTAQNLSTEIKRVTDEWKVTNKVVLAVTDNGANIKKAILDLGWKHFGCYAHTLNLAVSSALASSEEISDLLTKARSIVSLFKRSTQAWIKLRKYQEQASKTPKRPLQDVSTRWNSTYYMLCRLLEIKEEVNSALCNLQSSVQPLSAHDWNICESLCHILKPCEEVTREMSAQNYVSGSVVIPITRGLKSALGNAETSLHLVDSFRQDLLGEIGRRFHNLDRSRTFSLCMFLDPRFKLYFEDCTIAEEAKRTAVSLVAALINETDGGETQQSETSSATSTSTATPLEESSTFSVWKHYKETMQVIQPRRTAYSRAIVEVQRYLEDKIILFDGKTNVLQWWKDHEKTYPYLCRIAITKLNVLATSVPCERIFSAAGLILNDRRTRLGVRKLQQLMFLQQNS